MWLRWDLAEVVAAGLGLTAGVLAWRSPSTLARGSGFVREAALVLALYGLWQFAHALAVTRVTGAVAHGRSVWGVERALHLPGEVALQHVVLAVPLLVRLSNLYYAVVHVPALVVFLVWLFVRHRERYALIRTTLALSTAACLLVQMIPVAPPRMLPDLGFVDTGIVYGQSVYGRFGGGIADQLSAMPSVHVAWAVLVGAGVVAVGSGRWRWATAAHPVLTALVVVVTANHFWLDGVVAVGLLAAAFGVVSAAHRARASRHDRPRPVRTLRPVRPLTADA